MYYDLSKLRQSKVQEIHRDNISSVYFGEVSDDETQRRARSRIDWIVDQVDGGFVYDIGCSEGIAAILLSKKGVKVEAIDINSEVIEYASSLSRKISPGTAGLIDFLVQDLFSLDKIEQRFDAVIMGEVIEHVYEPGHMLTRAAMSLKDGGRLVVTTPWGYFPAPDHHQTFMLTDFMALIPEHVAVRELRIVDGYIRFVGELCEGGSDCDRTNLSAASLSKLLEETERAALEGQKFIRSVLDKRNGLLEEARRNAERLKAAKDEAIVRLQGRLEEVVAKNGDLRAMLVSRSELLDQARSAVAEVRGNKDRSIERLRRELSECRSQVNGLEEKLKDLEAERASRDAES